MNNKNNLYLKNLTALSVIIISGLIIDIKIARQGVSLPAFPVNIIFLILFMAFLTGTFFYFRKTYIIEWFTSIPATLSILSFFIIFILIMGFITQVQHGNWLDIAGLSRLTSTISFFLINILLLMNLGFTILKRLCQRLTLRNFAFFLNHAGLFLILIGGYAGSGDIRMLSLPLNEGEMNNLAFDKANRLQQIPFYIKLNNFTAEEYPPDPAVIETSTGMYIHQDKHAMMQKGQSGNTGPYRYEILEYFEYAVPTDSGFIESDNTGAVQAALIRFNNTITGWISTSSYLYHAKILDINNNHAGILKKPVFKKYQSIVDVISLSGTIENEIIEVNKPLSYRGWKIYQSSYDSKMGRWSITSVLQLVKDPWLPLVYAGIFMLLLGSCYLIYKGRRLNN